MKFVKSIIIKVITLVAFVLIPTGAVLAQGNFQNPLKFPTLATFLNALLDVVIIIGIPVVTLAIIYAGFLFISAQGSDDKITKAKTIFFWVIIGALIILGAKALATAIEGTVNDLTGAPASMTLVLEESPETYGLSRN